MNYNDFKEVVQNTIQKIQEEVSKNLMLREESLAFFYKICHVSHKDEYTIPEVVRILNNLINPTVYDKSSFSENEYLINQIKAAFDKKVEELKPFKGLSASPEKLSLMLEQVTSHEKETQEKIESIIEKCNLAQVWVYNEENLRIIGPELKKLKPMYREKLQQYYTSDILPNHITKMHVRDVIDKIKKLQPDLSKQIISQSIRYILTQENDILQDALKDCKALKLEIKDKNGKDWFMELQAAEKQVRQATADKKALENILAETLNNSSTTNSSVANASTSTNEASKTLEELKNLIENHSSLKDMLLFFNNPDGIYSGHKISYFLNKDAEDIPLGAIPALQTFITDHDITLSGVSVEF